MKGYPVYTRIYVLIVGWVFSLGIVVYFAVILYSVLYELQVRIDSSELMIQKRYFGSTFFLGAGCGEREVKISNCYLWGGASIYQLIVMLLVYFA